MAIAEAAGYNPEQETDRDLVGEFQNALALEPEQLQKMRRSIGPGNPEELSDHEIARRYAEYASGTTVDPKGKLDEERLKSAAVGSALAFQKAGDEIGFQGAINKIKDLFRVDTEEDCKKALEEIEQSE